MKAAQQPKKAPWFQVLRFLTGGELSAALKTYFQLTESAFRLTPDLKLLNELLKRNKHAHLVSQGSKCVRGTFKARRITLRCAFQKELKHARHMPNHFAKIGLGMPSEFLY